MNIELEQYEYEKLRSLGKIKFGMSMKDIFEVLGPTEGNLELNSQTASPMLKIADALGFGMRAAVEANYGERVLNYELMSKTDTEEITLMLTLKNDTLEEMELIGERALMLQDVNIANTDTIEKTKNIYEVSSKVLIGHNKILFPELGIMYSTRPGDTVLTLYSEKSVQDFLEDDHYEEETLVDVIEAIEWWLDEDEDEDEDYA